MVLGVFQMGLAYVCFTTGLKHTPPVTASLISGIEPVLNPTWVALVYGEAVTVFSVIGGIIVIGAIVVYSVYKARKNTETALPDV